MDSLDLVNISNEELIEIYELLIDFLTKLDKDIKSLEVKVNEE